MQLTWGQAFYHRLSAAVEARDLVTLASLYHPDAQQVSLSTGKILRGTAAIVAAVEETLRVAGTIRPVATESFVEHEDVLCVEATVATRFTQVQTYDLYVFHAGRIRYQFSGMLSPRQPAAPVDPGPPTTPERQFHRRYVAAFQALDFARLHAMYRPEAVLVGASTGVVVQGREAIVDGFRQVTQKNGPPRLKAITCFVDAPGLVCVEEIVAQKFGLPDDGPILDVQTYTALILQDGAIRYSLGGLITPRPAELKPMLQKLAERLGRAQERMVDSLIYGRWRR